MYTFATIKKILEQISMTSSSTKKVEIISKHAKDTLFRQVVLYALDPYRTFKMTGVVPYSISKRRAPIKEQNLIDYVFSKLDTFSKKKALTKKERDNFIQTIQATSSNVVTVINYILNKDLRCGAKTALFRKADPWFEENIPVHYPMKGYDDIEKFIKHVDGLDNAVWSYKLDGTRCWAVVNMQSGSITYLSFNGKELPNFGVFDEEIWKYANFLSNYLATTVTDYLGAPEKIIFDGEVVDIRGNFTKHMTNFRRLKNTDTTGFRFRIFDFITDNLRRSTYQKFSYRYHALLKMSAPIWTPSKNIDKDHRVSVLEHYQFIDTFSIETLLKTALHDGLEGLMIKSKYYEYQNKRSRDWCKVKQFETEDLPVVGKVEGTGKYKGSLGALVVNRKGVSIEVGSGYTDEERAEFWHQPPKCIEVKFQEVTDKGSLRFPIFVRVRDDKD